MISRQEARALIERALRVSRATETEITVGGGSLAALRFAENHIVQNTEQSWPHVSVRVGLRSGGKWRTGRSATEGLTSSDLRDAAHRAVAAARQCAPSPRYVEMAYPDEAGTWVGDARGAFDTATAGVGPARCAHEVAEIVLPSRRLGLSASGQLSVGQGGITNHGNPGIIAVGNSRGLFQYYPVTNVSMSCTVQHETGVTGWASVTGHRMSDLDSAALGRRARRLALAGVDPIELPAGSHTVVLEPAAVASLVWLLMAGFSRQRFDAGRSAIGERLGERLFGPHVTLLDDPLHPLLQSRPFDGEGVPTQRIELIRMGVPKGFMYHRYSAKLHNVTPTGHSAAQPSGAPEAARGPVLLGEDGTTEDLVRGTRRGVLVTRLWGNHFVDVRNHVVEGRTRDGLFAIEDGERTGALKNMRYRVSLIDVLRGIEAMGTPIRSGGAVVPPLRVNGFVFMGADR